jgi:nitrite reductase/ring-hydroxylating ferredoxin subunit
MAHLLARIVAMNDGWARPFGEFNRRWTKALFRPIHPIRDLLNGRWLGHPLHAASTDIPIGMLLGVVVLDLIGQPTAADILLVGTIVFMLLSALSGLADYSETTGTALTRATLHATLMVVALVLLIVSAVLRSGAPADRTVPIALAIIGFLIVTAGAFVGGDVAYVFGNMVSRHAFRGAGTKWIRLDTGELTDLAQLPEATPTKMRAGINDLMVVRIGTTVHALHNVCAHAGGPLNEGRLVDGCVECPWHASRFGLSDGTARRGPTVYDQPAYEVRAAEGGGYEVRRRATT